MTTIYINKKDFNKVEASSELEQYYNFLNIENNNHILNPGFKSPQININSLLDFKKYININNENPEYYFNLHPLKQPNSRKNNNINNFHLIGLDIERAEKIGKETIPDLDKVKDIIYSDIINKYKLTNYMLIFSGNGYHLYIMLNNTYSDADETNKQLNQLYSSLITQLSKTINPFIKITDRKDLASILRIPMTYNTKANRVVKIVDFTNLSNNNIFQKQINTYYNNFTAIKPTNNKNIILENKTDIFFTSILGNKDSWKEWNNILDSSIDRNDNFVKNLGIYIYENPETVDLAEEFIYQWDNSRVAPLQGWVKKAENSKFVVNYLELKKWCSNNNIIKWGILLDKQLKKDIFDGYEFYLLSDEREGMDYLIYYKNTNTYISGSITKILSELYTSLKKRNINIAKELNLDFSDKWDKLSLDNKTKYIELRLKTIIKDKLIKIDNISYRPNTKHIFTEEYKTYLNTYNKSEVFNNFIKKDINEYKFETIKTILLNICENNIDYYTYINNWLAHIVQRPTEKMATAIIFQGAQGTGKSLFSEVILGKIFGNNLRQISQTQMDSSYSEYMYGKQIIVANEVAHNSNKFNIDGRIKNMVTDISISLSEKFKNTRTIKNYTNFIFTSNHDTPLLIPKDDRRYSVFKSGVLKFEGKSISDTRDLIRYFINNKLFDETKEYFSYLKTLDLKDFNTQTLIKTQAKSDIININKSVAEKFIDSIREYKNINDFIEQEGLVELVNSYFILKDEFISVNNIYILYKQWMLLNGFKYNISKDKLGKDLKKLNITSNVKKINGKNIRVYQLINIMEGN